MSGKNHKMIDGKLLQTDKQYNALKMRQKEKIGTWLNEEITLYYRDHGNWPTREHEFQIVLDKVYEKIEAAEIWIPYSEIHKRFMGKRNSRINKVRSAVAKAEKKNADKESDSSARKPLTINLY